MSHYDEHDATLRRAFADLRTDDERNAPSLNAIIARRPRSASFVLRPGPVALAAALLIVAVGLYQTLSLKRRQLVVPDEIIALSAWRPATDVLLEASARTLLTQPPQLGASTIDIPGDLP